MSAIDSWSSMARSWRTTTSGTRSWPGAPGISMNRWPVGWVSRGDHDGSPWIRPSVDPCPTGAVTMESSRPCIHRSGSPASVTVRSASCVRVGRGGDRAVRPGSGYGLHRRSRLADRVRRMDRPGADTSVDTPSIGGPQLAIDPSGQPVPSSALPSGAMVDLEGAFDHPAATRLPTRCHTVRMPSRSKRPPLGWRVGPASSSPASRSDPDYPMSDAAGITVSDELRVRSNPGLTGIATSCSRRAPRSGSSMGRSSRPTTSGSRSSSRRSTSVTACLASDGWPPRTTARSPGSRSGRSTVRIAPRSTSRT